MKVFDPVRTQSSPSRAALVRIAATSVPASGSVTARAPMESALDRRDEPAYSLLLVPEAVEVQRRQVLVGAERGGHPENGISPAPR